MPRTPLSLTLAVLEADAHFAMIKPPSWHDPDGSVYSNWNPDFGWRTAGCTGEAPPAGEENNLGCISQWYTNGTSIPGKRTLPDALISYMKIATSRDPVSTWTWSDMQKNPWMAPGTAPMWSPCGVDGGNPKGCPAGNPGKDGCVGGGYGHGPDARSLPGNTEPSTWTAGGEAEVMFGVTANHGGGYIYRLCPMPEAGRKGLTEECFQSTPLRFIGDAQWLQYGGDEKNRTAIPALRTTEGTHPAGSQWTRQPIPACGTYDGGGYVQNYGFCIGSQFKPPAPGVYGFYGMTQYDAVGCKKYRLACPKDRTLTHWSVVDKVAVPHDIAPGEYVLSFRLDCEQTPQIWSQCADVRVVAKTDVIV